MRRELAHAALGGAVAAAASNTTVDLFFWGFWGDAPQFIEGSVIDAKPAATTLEISCNTAREESIAAICSLPAPTMTVIQGPSTYSVAYSISESDVVAKDQMICTGKGDAGVVTCTDHIVYEYSKTSKTVSQIQTRDDFSHYSFPVTITAGADKIKATPGGAAAVPTATVKPTTVSIFFPGGTEASQPNNGVPKGAVASVVAADAAATTYAVRCPFNPNRQPNSASDCDFPFETMTYVAGPSTFSWGYDQFLELAEAQMDLNCKVGSNTDALTCSETAINKFGPSTESFATVETFTDYKSATMELTVTAGLEKLSATPGSGAASTAKPTGKAEHNAAGQVQAKGALFAGAAVSAILGFVMML